jgi:hypothetical protein
MQVWADSLTGETETATVVMPFTGKRVMLARKFDLKTVTWRVSRPRWRLSAPPGFIRPCEPRGYRTSSRRSHPIRVNPSALQPSLPTP